MSNVAKINAPKPLKAPNVAPPTSSVLKVKPDASVAAPMVDIQEQNEPQPARKLPPVDPDPYVGSCLIPGLNLDTFFPHVSSKDATFVLFYDPCDPMSAVAKIQVKGAAIRTNRLSHQYVAVDCSSEAELCAMQGIKKAPAYQLFSRGTLVGTYTDVESMRAKQIQNFVETSPVIKQVKCSR